LPTSETASEGTVAIAEQHRHDVLLVFSQREVELAVAVHVQHGERGWKIDHRGRDERVLERAVAVTEKYLGRFREHAGVHDR
jgi:hypothetical protein